MLAWDSGYNVPLTYASMPPINTLPVLPLRLDQLSKPQLPLLHKAPTSLQLLLTSLFLYYQPVPYLHPRQIQLHFL